MTGIAIIFLLSPVFLTLAMAWWKLAGRMDRVTVFLVACGMGCFSLTFTSYLHLSIVEGGVGEWLIDRPLRRSDHPVVFWLWIGVLAAANAFFWGLTGWLFQTAFMRPRTRRRAAP